MIFTKINTTGIVKDHLRTLVHEHSGKLSVSDLVLFYGTPLITAFLLVWFKGAFGKTIGGVLVTSFSVFAALLFNLLLLIYDIVRKSDNALSAVKSKFLGQIYHNISYAILTAISTIVLLLGYFVALALPSTKARVVLAFLVFALAANFILTILMILKRVHVLLSKEFENPAGK